MTGVTEGGLEDTDEVAGNSSVPEKNLDETVMTGKDVDSTNETEETPLDKGDRDVTEKSSTEDGEDGHTNDDITDKLSTDEDKEVDEEGDTTSEKNSDKRPTMSPPFDACFSAPCQNGGTCRNAGRSYWCSCTFEYRGRNCEEMDY